MPSPRPRRPMRRDRHDGSTPTRRWIGYLAGVLALLAAAGISVSWFLLSSWSELHVASRPEADQAFMEAMTQAGGGAPYLEISDTGAVLVHRELERPRPVALGTLHLLAWEPDGERLLRMALPFWFIRIKMSGTLNLGTLTTALAGDWEHLDLRVSEQDLEKRGPGIILDHRLSDGKRLLVWSE